MGAVFKLNNRNPPPQQVKQPESQPQPAESGTKKSKQEDVLSPELQVLKKEFGILDWWQAYKIAAQKHGHPTQPIEQYIHTDEATEWTSKFASKFFKWAGTKVGGFNDENVNFLIRVAPILNRASTFDDEQHRKAMVNLYKDMIKEGSDNWINIGHDESEAFKPYVKDADEDKWFKEPVDGVEPDAKNGPFEAATGKILMLIFNPYKQWRLTTDFDDFLRDNEDAIKTVVNDPHHNIQTVLAHSGHYNKLSMFDDHFKNEILAYDHYPRRYQVDDYLYGQNKMDNANVHTFGGYDGADDIYLEQVIGTTVILMALTILCCVCIGVAICWMYGIYTFKKKMDESKKKEDHVYQIANDEESII